MQTLHVISHTHWDREWYLTFQQFRLKLVHLIDNMLNILDEDPDFKHFMLDGQTIVLDDYLLMRPEKEELLRGYIQNGRILIGPWHILPDMFLVSPEAHIRNLLQGARTARRFGSKMSIGYIPDPFGHPGQVPQILKGFGIEVASLWRGLSDEPAELWWESPDGSSVFLAYLRDSYGNGANLPVGNKVLFAEQIASAGDSIAAHSAVNDHLIMQGTDHMEPSPRTSAAIAYANQHLQDKHVIHSTLPAYVKAVKAQIDRLNTPIPVVKGELRNCSHSPLLPGVLSTRMWIKQRNHNSQILLEKWAEPFSVFANHLVVDKGEMVSPSHRTHKGTSSDRIRNVAPIIRQAWRLLMENHPHDSICGCSIDQVHDEMKPRFDQVDQIGEEITRQSLQTLAQTANTQKKDTFSAIVVFNPLGFQHHDMVEVDLNVPERIHSYQLIDEDNNIYPYEVLGASKHQHANVILDRHTLRDMFSTILDGYVAGMAITHVSVSRDGDMVTINATLDGHSQPNFDEWKKAEKDLIKYESDPGVTKFHVIAYTPMASRIRFVSPEIPPLGWRPIWLREVKISEEIPSFKVSPLLKPFLPLGLRFAQSEIGEKLLARQDSSYRSKPPFIIENEYFEIEADQKSGTLKVLDKRNNTVFTGLNRFVDGGDAGDEYNYSPPLKDSLYAPRPVSVKVSRNQLIPWLEIDYELKIPSQLTPDRKGRSKKFVSIPISSRVTLIPSVDRIDIKTEINNLAKDHRLRVHFPAPFIVEKADYDGHFEVVQRLLGIPESGENWVEEPRPEAPQRAFTDISDGMNGLMVANRGLPEVEVIPLVETGETEIAITLIRSVGALSRDDMQARKGHAGPAIDTPGAQVQGTMTFEYSIIPHKGGWQQAYQQAFAFETPMRAIESSLHEGEIADHGSFVSHTPAEFVVSTIKESEDGNGWLVRGYNISPENISLTLKPIRRFSSATQVNLAEEELRNLKYEHDGKVTVPVSGHQIVSILFAD